MVATESTSSPVTLQIDQLTQALGTPRRKKTATHRRKKCLFVHDSVLSDFDSTKFSREFDVTTYQTGSCYALCKDNRFKNKLRALSPECIFIHVGLKDILDRRKVNDIRKCFEDLIWYLLEETDAKICFSLIIPTRNSDSLNQ